VVTIRVPVPWNAQETLEERKAKVLRCARQLIDHACGAAGMAPAATQTEGGGVADVLGAVSPPVLEGIAQELGLVGPTSGLRRRSRKAEA
jgi:hypothetical protein